MNTINASSLCRIIVASLIQRVAYEDDPFLADLQVFLELSDAISLVHAARGDVYGSGTADAHVISGYFGLEDLGTIGTFGSFRIPCGFERKRRALA